MVEEAHELVVEDFVSLLKVVYWVGKKPKDCVGGGGGVCLTLDGTNVEGGGGNGCDKALTAA
jgi:hypothetical protein